MNADKFFTEDEKERIRQAVVAAESKTAGEIVPMIVTSSARYTEIELLGLVVGLFAGMISRMVLERSWGSPIFQLWPVIGAFVGFLLGRMSSSETNSRVEETVSPKRFTHSRSRRSPNRACTTLAITPGFLILVSLLEHRVEVLADRGINAKVRAGTWDEIVHIITAGSNPARPAMPIAKRSSAAATSSRPIFRAKPTTKTNCPIASSPSSAATRFRYFLRSRQSLGKGIQRHALAKTVIVAGSSFSRRFLTARSSAQDRLNFAYISPNAGSSSVLWVAKDAGIFKKHGLDVNVIYIEGTPKALMSLFAGEFKSSPAPDRLWPALKCAAPMSA